MSMTIFSLILIPLFPTTTIQLQPCSNQQTAKTTILPDLTIVSLQFFRCTKVSEQIIFHLFLRTTEVLAWSSLTVLRQNSHSALWMTRQHSSLCIWTFTVYYLYTAQLRPQAKSAKCCTETNQQLLTELLTAYTFGRSRFWICQHSFVCSKVSFAIWHSISNVALLVLHRTKYQSTSDR